MNGSSKVRSLGRFLYTQNPFYLISCGLIMYGLTVATRGGDLDSGSTLLAKCMIGYTLLMSLTVVGVVRLGKVWPDARSIFFVVLISQLALSVGFDLLCIDNWQLGGRLLLGGLGFSILSTEFVLHACRIRFPFWYRATYYALLMVFFAIPVAAGYSVSQNQLGFARWSAPLFSSLIGMCLLLLVPAIRRGNRYIHHNGTPWQWPLYPLSAFVVVTVVAGIRSHAIWMAFGSFYGAISFEPFLLLPIALAILILIVELARRLHFDDPCYVAMLCAPAMLLSAYNRNGLTDLAIQRQLQDHAGSALTLSFLALLTFYVYTWRMRIRGSPHGVLITLIAASFFAAIPTNWERLGFMPWMIMVPALLVMVAIAWRRRDEVHWLVLAMIGSITIVRAGYDTGQPDVALLAGGSVFLIAAMTIGAMSDTTLANTLRQLAAAGMLAGGILAVVWQFRNPDTWWSVAAIAGLAVAAIVYSAIVKRTGWIQLAAIQSAGTLVLAGHLRGWTAADFEPTHWPIQSGVLCFFIGLTITSMKTNLRKRLWRPRWGGQYRSGF